MDFSRRLLQPEAPGFGEIREAIWRYFVMKLPSKNVKNHDNLRFHYSAPGPTKMRTIFPHTSVLPKPPQLPYGAKYVCWPYFLFFQFLPYWTLLVPGHATTLLPPGPALQPPGLVCEHFISKVGVKWLEGENID